MRILFQGDSITDGGYEKNGDMNHNMGQSYPYIVAARLGYEHPERNYEFLNRGLSGSTCAQLCGRWQEEALDLKPDVISILVGTNDAGRESRSLPELSFHGMEPALDLLLSQTKAVLPQTKLIVMEPFLLDSGNLDAQLFCKRFDLLRDYQRIIREKAGEYGTLFIPLQERFFQAAKKQPAAYWLWDSVHPTYAGHGLIAEAFIQDTRGYI